MTGTIKTVCVINLMFAVVVVCGHVVYDFWSGLLHHYPLLAQNFLHGEIQTPLWLTLTFIGSVIFAVVELFIVLTYFAGRIAERKLRRHRIFCGCFGALGLYLFFIAIIVASAYSNNVLIYLGITPADAMVVIYVGASHLAYAFFGGDARLRLQKEWAGVKI